MAHEPRRDGKGGDMAGIDPAIAALIAKQQITETLHLVARGTDRGDVDLYASCFHADGTDYHGLANGPMQNLLKVLGTSKLLYTQHAITNVLIDLIDADTATSEACFNASHQSRDVDGQVWDEEIRGRYLDRFERRGRASWKIAQRVVLWDWSRMMPSGKSWFDHVRERPGADDRFVFGRRDREDFLYTRTLPAELQR
jgi:hypothetical protein